MGLAGAGGESRQEATEITENRMSADCRRRPQILSGIVHLSILLIRGIGAIRVSIFSTVGQTTDDAGGHG